MAIVEKDIRRQLENIRPGGQKIVPSDLAKRIHKAFDMFVRRHVEYEEANEAFSTLRRSGRYPISRGHGAWQEARDRASAAHEALVHAENELIISIDDRLGGVVRKLFISARWMFDARPLLSALEFGIDQVTMTGFADNEVGPRERREELIARAGIVLGLARQVDAPENIRAMR